MPRPYSAVCKTIITIIILMVRPCGDLFLFKSNLMEETAAGRLRVIINSRRVNVGNTHQADGGSQEKRTGEKGGAEEDAG